MIIIDKDLKDVRYGLGSVETVRNWYTQIKSSFGAGEYRIFAEPIPMGNKIKWATDYTDNKANIVNYNQLTIDQQSAVQDLLTVQINKLKDVANKFTNKSLLETLMKCIEIPDLKDVFLIKTAEGNKVVLTQWGFTSDIPGAEKGLLEKIINTKKVPMVFNVVYQDGKFATDEEIHFEYEGKKEIHRSNLAGQITVEKVKINSNVKAYQIEEDQQINHHTFSCYEFGNYQIVLPLKLDMKFKVIDSNKKILEGMRFNFAYKNVEETITSNAEGIMMLPKIKVGTEVKVFQLKDGNQENLNHYICEKGKDEYLIIIQVPPIVEIPNIVQDVPIEPPPINKNYKMKFKVVDDNNEVVINAEITVKYAGKTAKLRTDSQGNAELEGVEPGTKVNVVAKGEIKKK